VKALTMTSISQPRSSKRSRESIPPFHAQEAELLGVNAAGILAAAPPE